jgi:hypothetical protein
VPVLPIVASALPTSVISTRAEREGRVGASGAVPTMPITAVESEAIGRAPSVRNWS